MSQEREPQGGVSWLGCLGMVLVVGALGFAMLVSYLGPFLCMDSGGSPCYGEVLLLTIAGLGVVLGLAVLVEDLRGR